MTFRDRVVDESRGEALYLLDRAKRWGIYLLGGMLALTLSIAAFVAVHMAAGAPPAEAQGTFLVWMLVTLFLIHKFGNAVFRA